MLDLRPLDALLDLQDHGCAVVFGLPQQRWARCTGCGQIQPVRGGTRTQPLCARCTRPDPPFWRVCPTCGTTAQLRPGPCTRCVVDARLRELLGDQHGQIRPELEALHGSLAGAERPDTVLDWLGKNGENTGAAILRRSAGEPPSRRISDHPTWRCDRQSQHGTRPAMTTLLLLHGGLWEDDMDAERFWASPGIIAGLQRRGFQVLAPDRPSRAPSWAAEADHLAPTLPQRPVILLGGSNGCSVAVRLALAQPHSIERLLLAWPATAGDPTVDARVRSDLGKLGACPRIIDELLAGQPLRGITDTELAALQMPIGVLPSVPENPLHQRHTVEALLRQAQHAKELPGCPEPPRPAFASHRERFLTAVTQFATSGPADRTHSDSWNT